jgi:ATP-binding cassette subfamily B multidrug efflux pump
LLLLDDCLSAVDTETEDVILNNIHRNHQERTTIVVSHRISTIRNANDILVLDHGRVIEQGSHEELLAKNGSYAEMHRKQLEKN